MGRDALSILNIGSLNIDLVYRVPHIVRGGETITSTSFQTFAGGKGANQSVALARAGATVQHVGRIGADGRWLIDKLAKAGVSTDAILIDEQTPTGHARAGRARPCALRRRCGTDAERNQ